MKLERIEMELRMSRIQIEQEQKHIEQLRQQRAEIYEKEAAQDTDISQKFDGYKTPSPIEQKHYNDAKAAIKAVYYTIQEAGKTGLDMDEIMDILATRKENEIRDAMSFLRDGGDIEGPTLDWKWRIYKE